MTDVRYKLQDLNKIEDVGDLEYEIWRELRKFSPKMAAFDGLAAWPILQSMDLSIVLLKILEFDWIIASVNGQVGETPYAKVGNVKDSYGETPLISLWLATMRCILGDERLSTDA